MANRLEVKVLARGPTEGTRHRRDKGVDPEYRAQVGGGDSAHAELPARGGLMEVIGACPFRAKAKRRKACRAGELAPSSEARNPPVAR